MHGIPRGILASITNQKLCAGSASYTRQSGTLQYWPKKLMSMSAFRKSLSPPSLKSYVQTHFNRKQLHVKVALSAQQCAVQGFLGCLELSPPVNACVYTRSGRRTLKTLIEEPLDEKRVILNVLEEGKVSPDRQWLIRMQNQDGYLSWCRNAYLSLGVSVAITVSSKGVVPLPYDTGLHTGIIGVAHVLLVLAELNMLFGSAEFIYQMIRTRSLTQMSWFAIAAYTLFCALHCYLFLDIFTNMESEEPDGGEI